MGEWKRSANWYLLMGALVLWGVVIAAFGSASTATVLASAVLLACGLLNLAGYFSQRRRQRR